MATGAKAVNDRGEQSSSHRGNNHNAKPKSLKSQLSQLLCIHAQKSCSNTTKRKYLISPCGGTVGGFHFLLLCSPPPKKVCSDFTRRLVFSVYDFIV